MGVRADTVHDVRRPAACSSTASCSRTTTGTASIDSDDIAWIGDNGTSRVQNMPTFDGIKPQARLPRGSSSSSRSGTSDRWQAPGVVPVLELRRHGPPLAPAGLQRRGPDVLRRQLDGHPQLDDQQPRGPAALHAQVRVQAVRLVHDSQDRGRPGRPAPVHDRAADVEAGELSPAHPVRRSAGRRDRPRRAAPDRRRRSQRAPTTSPTRPSSTCISRRRSSSGGDSSSTSSSTGSTSSTPTRPPTWTSSREGYGRITNIPQGRRFRGGVRFQF